LNLFDWLIPSDLFLKNTSYVLDVYCASICIARHLEMMTNNMGQTFGREKHFHAYTTLEPFS
jgi:hypothetical protein